MTLHAFGLLVAVGIWLAVHVINRQARREGLDPRLSERLATWILVGGFLGAHLVDRLVYFPSATFADPWSILRLWDGLSSFGGFLGAIAAIVLFVRRGVPGEDRWRYLDIIAIAFPFGWIFGRLGCFVAFDHPGAPTDFALGQRYQDGIVRHNLGLEEALYTILVAAALAWFARSRRPPGFFVGALALMYAPFRFTLDFLRHVDVRYFGFTPGQYGSLAVVAIGVLILLRAGQMRAAPARVVPL